MIYGQTDKYELLKLHYKCLDSRPSIKTINTQLVDGSAFDALVANGLVKLENRLDEQTLEQIFTKCKQFVEKKQQFNRIRKHSAETLDDIQSGVFKYFSQQELDSPDFILENHVKLLAIKDPLLAFPDLIDIALAEPILSFVSKYHGAVPLLTYLKITISFPNSANPIDTQNFHKDYGAHKILKVVVPLNEFTDTHSGPFTYVLGSHTQSYPGVDTKSRFSDQEILTFFQPDAIYECTGTRGDVFLVESTGLHKGKPPRNCRIVLIFNFCLHPEVGFPWNKLKISRMSLQKLSHLQRSAISKEVFDIID